MTDHQSGEPPGNRFAERLLSLDDLGRLREPPPLYRAADGRPLLYRGTLAQLSGGYGTFKSFIAIDAACTVASGLATTEPEDVVFVAAEGAAGLRKRILAWCDVHDVEAATVGAHLRVHNGAIQLGSPVDMDQVKAHCIEDRPALLIVDTRAKCSIGVEENDSTAQGPLIRAVEDIVDKTGTTALVIHHTGKTGSDRGTNAWPSGVWSHLVLTKGKKEFTASIECEKHKDAPSGCKHDVRLVRHQLPETAVSPRRHDEPTADYDERRCTLAVTGTPSVTQQVDPVSEVEEHLDRLDVPLAHGRDRARATLAEHDVRVRNEVLTAAIKRRRERAEGGMRPVPEAPGQVLSPSPGDSAPVGGQSPQVAPVPSDSGTVGDGTCPRPPLSIERGTGGPGSTGTGGVGQVREQEGHAAADSDYLDEAATESGMAPESGRSLIEGKRSSEPEPQGEGGEVLAAACSGVRQSIGPQDDGQDHEHVERVLAEPGIEAAAGTAPLRSTNPLPSGPAQQDSVSVPEIPARSASSTVGASSRATELGMTEDAYRHAVTLVTGRLHRQLTEGAANRTELDKRLKGSKYGTGHGDEKIRAPRLLGDALESLLDQGTVIAPDGTGVGARYRLATDTRRSA
ncbi:AAA family ATPase [Tsukamurella paurometabola]|uniref:Uncharacterized protein n=1 Tax=Tsukamurella paurometabola TaxID=2061 RepID=A0A3P8KFP6_TSUPA|nr:AAA family ATPase [Tsukamurella paurometabola]UEA81794.1 helicase RepA family protein [Tsukamurella paurometabola]VDR38808.1 Uncharacterised protein [Tsukamurella paurometabola]